MRQSEIIDFLMKPESYGLPANSVIERFDTHISIVFLAGEYAYKLKRAIQLPFVDFRTLSDRKKYAELEIQINQNGAPDLYIGLVPVTLEEGGLLLDGKGEPHDWLVKMHRFDQGNLFENLNDVGKLSASSIEALSDYLVTFYKQAKQNFKYGGSAGMERAFAGHFKAFENCPDHIAPPATLKRLNNLVNEEIKRVDAQLNDRQETGMVRHCHGDLHLRNICYFKNQICLFDAIEFEPDFAIIDVLYDLSFLLMDLCHRERVDLANAVLNRYLGQSGDVTGLNLLRLFMASRAVIRTHVDGVASKNQTDQEKRLVLESGAKKYLQEAFTYLKPPSPNLIALGGLSGSGKSVLAKKLAPTIGRLPGAYIARTDMIRKRIMGVKPQDKLNEYGYSKGVTAHTYNTLYVEIRLALSSGYSVIVDGVFARKQERDMLEMIAKDMGVPFEGIWLEADQQLLKKRVQQRKNDVSDADEKIVSLQAEFDLGKIDWTQIDASQTVENVYETVSLILKEKMD